MAYMAFFRLGYSLVDKAKDGNLTLEEVAECLSESFPDQFQDVLEEIDKAQEDGKISVSEVVKIAAAFVL